MNLTHEWTESQIMRLPDVGGKYELVEGELVVVAAGRKHEIVVFRLILALGNFVSETLGQVFSSSLGYWMKNGDLRSPDVSFVAKVRLDDMTHDPDGFLYGAPDLSIEILSPSNVVSAMRKKTLEYFENGSRLVWIVNPNDRTVTVLHPDGSETVLSDSDSLDGEDVLPGFSLEVWKLFKGLE